MLGIYSRSEQDVRTLQPNIVDVLQYALHVSRPTLLRLVIEFS